MGKSAMEYADDYYDSLIFSSGWSENGMLFLEIGYDQKESVTAFLQQHFTDIVCKKDYAGNDRIIIARKK